MAFFLKKKRNKVNDKQFSNNSTRKKSFKTLHVKGKSKEKETFHKKNKHFKEDANFEDEEIESEEDCFFENNEGAKSDKDEYISEEEVNFFETTEENKIKLAKKYLDDLKLNEDFKSNLVEEDDSSNDEEDFMNKKIDKKIQFQNDLMNKRLKRFIADELKVKDSTFYKGHLLSPTCVCISSINENVVYTGSKDCAIIKWDVSTGQKTVFPGRRRDFDCGGHFEQVMDLCLSESHNLLCSVGCDKLVRLWDCRLDGKRCVEEFRGHTDAITCVKADNVNDVSMVYTGSKDKSIKIWNIKACSYMDSLFGHTNAVLCMDILNSSRPLTGGADKTARCWKVKNETHLLFQSHSSFVDACVYLNANIFATACHDGSLYLWDANQKKPLSVNTNIYNGKWICSLTSLPYSDMIVSGGCDGSVKFLKVKSAENASSGKAKLTEFLSVKTQGFINALSISKSSKFLIAVAGKEHKLGRWESLGKSVKNGIYVIPLELPEQLEQ